tara:strand:- start:27 stop:356 length:330 start_codon:yes stop_codon:yes gene_type:complete
MSIQETTLRKYFVSGGTYNGHVAVIYTASEIKINDGTEHNEKLGFHSKIMGRVLSVDGKVIDRSFPQSWVPELEGVPFYSNESEAVKSLEEHASEASGKLVPLLPHEGN